MANDGATYQTLVTPLRKMQQFINVFVNYIRHRLITRLGMVTFINMTPFLFGTVPFEGLANVENKLCSNLGPMEDTCTHTEAHRYQKKYVFFVQEED